VKGSDNVYMSAKGKKYDLEEKRRRLRSQGWDLDIIDQVRFQRLRERREWEKERETGDIYDDEQRGEMLKADGITAAENAFMQGREMKRKKRKRSTHKDTVSVQLAEDEYKED
jgi:hypothetical protein